MSSCRVPPTTSKGESCTAPGSSNSILGITFEPRASLTPHVSVSVNCSATWTAVLSVFHQHLVWSGSDCCAWTKAVQNKISAALKTPSRQSLLLMNVLLHFSQSPFGDEFNQNRFHFPAVEPDSHDVEIRVSREFHHLLLPFVHAVGQPRKFAARNGAHPAGFHIECLDPACRDFRKLVGKARVHHHQKNIVRGIKDGKLFDHIR